MRSMGRGRLLFLGTGGSMGVPVIGCNCRVCSSTHPFDHRLRPSALVTVEGRNLLIDAGPDLRAQALKYQIKQIDGVLITHAHNDHVAGIDDLRQFYKHSKQPIPLLLSAETYRDLSIRYSYIFSPRKEGQSILPQFALKCLRSSEGVASFAGVEVGYVSYSQAAMGVNGFRFGKLAYITDIKEYSQDLYRQLEGVETLVITAMRLTPSPLHFSLKEAIDFSHRIGAKESWISHMGHEMGYVETSADLPAHVHLAHDGLKIEFTYE